VGDHDTLQILLLSTEKKSGGVRSSEQGGHKFLEMTFIMIRWFKFLHRCYFVWEEIQFFSDCFICCCKPDIFLLLQIAQ
jgi:hypothetical protein